MSFVARLFVLLAVLAPAARAGFVSSTVGPATIPDSGTAAPYPLVFNISGASGPITNVTLSFANFSHTFPADLGMMLVSPTGQGTIIMAGAGGSADMTNFTLTFSDSGITVPDFSGAITNGTTYRPTYYSAENDGGGGTGTLFSSPAPLIPGVNPIPFGPVGGGPSFGSFAAFNGFDANGAWRLFVQDFAAQDQGGFASATLNITTADTAAVPAPATVLIAPLALAAFGLRRRLAPRG